MYLNLYTLLLIQLNMIGAKAMASDPIWLTNDVVVFLRMPTEVFNLRYARRDRINRRLQRVADQPLDARRTCRN
jgi:hypothetical protein